jgi:hypothetical protein
VKVTCSDTRTDVREKPTLHCVVDLSRHPLALFRLSPAIVLLDRAQQLRALRKDWVGETSGAGLTAADPVKVLSAWLEERAAEHRAESSGDIGCLARLPYRRLARNMN